MVGTCSGGRIKTFLHLLDLSCWLERLYSQLVGFPLREAGRVPWGERAAAPVHPCPLWIGASTDASLSYSVSMRVSRHKLMRVVTCADVCHRHFLDE